MRIAVTYDDTEVYQHFGDTSYFKIYDVQDGKVVKSEIVPTGDASHVALVPFLAERGVDTLICGGLGEKAFKLLEAAGIKTYGSAKCDTDIAVQNLIDGKLIYDPNIYAGHKCGCASSMKVY